MSILVALAALAGIGSFILGLIRLVAEHPKPVRKVMEWKVSWLWFVGGSIACGLGVWFYAAKVRGGGVPLQSKVFEVTLPIASAKELAQDVVRGKTVFISQLPLEPVNFPTGRSQAVSGKKFVGCEIFGPAVIHVTARSTVIGCRLPIAVGPEDIFLEAKGGFLQGVIVFAGCVFDRCTMDGVMFAGSKEEMDAVRRGIAGR